MTNHELQTLLALERTKLPPDGVPLYNRLIFANSPYLLQHAQNPVDWREWNPETRAEARSRNLPLFVSIGYATCHWCHVMAHESFEDDEVAHILNHAFIPVKVDREERPDLDQFCMAACQALTGSGGWPLNCFLKPDGAPFYAVTYLPRESRHGVPGLLALLENIAQLWQHRQNALERNARSLMTALEQLNTPRPAPLTFDPAALADQAAADLRRLYDQSNAGFGAPPKFPMPPRLLFLLGRKDPAEREMALATLRALRNGGIWDQLGGGIHRYSTDRRWRIPHFEKMLYDQALVAYTALAAYGLTQERCYREMADDLLTFALRELAAPEGGFYCGLDADAGGEEGACYLWRRAEIEEALGEDAAWFCTRFGVPAGGNGEEPGEQILFLARPEAGEPEQLRQACKRLLLLRNQREQPLRDSKILTGWNGLMLAALARGAAIRDNRCWLAAARRTAAAISSNLTRPDGRLLRSRCNGSSSEIPAFLEDYAFLAWGRLELYHDTHDPADCDAAARLCREALRLFQTVDGRMQTVGNDVEPLPLPLFDHHDGALPGGASVLVMVLRRLAATTDDMAWERQAWKLLRPYQDALQRAPTDHLWLLAALTPVNRRTAPP